MKEIALKVLAQHARTKPNDYVETVCKHGTVEKGIVFLSDEAWTRLREIYEEPSVLDLARNFAEASIRFAAAGFPLVSKDEFHARLKICDECVDPLGDKTWDGQARLGLGKCRLCGCTRLKQWWQTEKCPLDKWPKSGQG